MLSISISPNMGLATCIFLTIYTFVFFTVNKSDISFNIDQDVMLMDTIITHRIYISIKSWSICWNEGYWKHQVTYPNKRYHDLAQLISETSAVITTITHGTTGYGRPWIAFNGSLKPLYITDSLFSKPDAS